MSTCQMWIYFMTKWTEDKIRNISKREQEDVRFLPEADKGKENTTTQ